MNSEAFHSKAFPSSQLVSEVAGLLCSKGKEH